MPTATDLETRYQACRSALDARGQTHVLQWWNELDVRQRGQLLSDIESIPWSIIDPLISTHVLAKPALVGGGRLEPAPVYPQVPGPDQHALYQQAIQIGTARLGQGQVAAATVAGGQGTRLGFSGPKGAVVVTPVGRRSLFHLFAETVLAARRRYRSSIPWYIMTSPGNHQETVAYFQDHGHFGLPTADVCFFSQGRLPVFDFSGRLLLDQKDRLSFAPDGHGGALPALRRSGALEDLQRRGVEVLSYFQIDNPLVKPFDPLFIGLHVMSGSQMSTKVARKVDDHERVGNVCLRDGRLTIIEYSDFPQSCAQARDPAGRREFDAGNLAIHLFDVEFIRQITATPLSLPVRRAEKGVAYVDQRGLRIEPTLPNAVKLETFIFDVLPSARNPLLLEVDRAEEFSPVKNLTGVDSLNTSQCDQIRRACRWLEAAGIPVPRTPGGEPDVVVAISPLLALDDAELKTKASQIAAPPRGAALYLE